ncbi:MarR family transcriptional regulator [Mucilaginibacter sp.]|uniref:MarR family winged helix-turn-helix transcriptional regulator n=1 Tax=Mucilaginibacter sp. TaxID=1882438 RepID=UPI003264A3B3
MADCNTIEDSKRITCKLVYLLKRSIDDWSMKKLCRMNHLDFNNAHLPFFMSIGTTGITNNALAAKMSVSKQAASKIVKELEATNMVRSEKSADDARASMLYLTPDGEKFYQHLKTQVENLENEYKKVVGVKNYEAAIDVMLKLVKFHEEYNCTGEPVV